MNYLAHALLAEGNDEWIVGSLIADWKPHSANLPMGIEQGIFLHQRIDSICDSSPHFQHIRASLRPAAGLYAAVMADIVCDNMLCDHWKRYSEVALTEFTADVYKSLSAVAEYAEVPFAPQSGKSYPDWLASYAHQDGLERAIERVKSKVKSSRRFPNSAEVIQLYFEVKGELSSPFLQLFDELVVEVSKLKSSLK